MMDVVTAELTLLGRPLLTVAGHPARLHSAKALALLAYLSLEPGVPHSRAKLAGLLWGEDPDDEARHSLRQVLYSLRRALDARVAHCLMVDEDAVGFAPHDAFRVDVSEFLALAGRRPPDLGSLRRAAQLYQGTLLEGLELSGCPGFEEWLFFRREALEQQLLAVLQALTERLVALGSWQEAGESAQRLVTLDPLHEAGYRFLMQVQAALGDRDGVRHQYRLCADVLAREMGIKPSRETRALFRQLLAAPQALSPSRESLPWPRAGDQAPTLPFVGREREMAVLQAKLKEAAANQGRVILISGEAGMGKTRLLAEFVRQSAGAATAPVRCLLGKCYEPEAHAPYAVWGDALKPLSTPDWSPLLAGLAEVWIRQLARLLPTLATPADDILGTTAAESRLRLFQGVLQCIVGLTRRCTLLLGFDDLQWADEASLELLHYVSRQARACRLLIVGAYRPDPASDRASLAHLLRGIEQATASSLLELAPLGPETIGRILAGLGRHWPADLPLRLYQHSDGNPFLLVETVHALAQSGRLHRQPDGDLIEAETGPWPVPRRVHELVESRLAPLAEEERRVLAAGSVIGRPFSLRYLRRVCGLPELRVVGLVEQLLQGSFLEETSEAPPDTLLDFCHDYLRRVVYEGTSAVQRRALHRRAARALLALHRTRPPSVTEEVAYHLEQGGEAEAVVYLGRAGRQAEELFAYHHAAELYTRALALHHAYLADDLPGRFDLLSAREAVLDRQGRRAEQAEDIVALLALADTLGEPSRRAKASVRQAGYLSYKGQYTEAREAGERALSLFRRAGDRSGEAQALRELGFLHWSAGDYGTALAYGRDALQLHRQLGDVEGEATALHNLAEIYRSLGSPRQALTHYESAWTQHWALGNRQCQGLTLYGMAHALRQLGDLNLALVRYEEALGHCEAAGDRLMVSRIHHALSGLHQDAGALDQARNHMYQALQISREMGYGPGIAHGLIGLSDIEIRLGCPDAACEHLREAITWLHLLEDQPALAQAEARLAALENGSSELAGLPPAKGWVKSHVSFAEGKVYCEFESPMARQVQALGHSITDMN